MSCKHEAFNIDCKVARLEDVGKFQLDIKVICLQCKTPFQFKGLKIGLDLNGAMMSVDSLEARLAIVPSGVEPSPLQRAIGIRGFH